MKNIIIITGASSGIGQEFALQIDTAFSNIDEIWLIARREDRLMEVARVMEHTTRLIVMDVTDEYAMDDIDNELRYIRENINIMPEVCIRYFRPDSKKSGGSYLEHRGNVKKIDENSRRLIFTDGTGIDISFIVYISH